MLQSYVALCGRDTDLTSENHVLRRDLCWVDCLRLAHALVSTTLEGVKLHAIELLKQSLQLFGMFQDLCTRLTITAEELREADSLVDLGYLAECLSHEPWPCVDDYRGTLLVKVELACHRLPSILFFEV